MNVPETQILKTNLESFTEYTSSSSSSSTLTKFTEERVQPHYRQETLQYLKRGRGRSTSGRGDVHGRGLAASMDIDADLRSNGRDGAGNLVGNDKVRLW